jgi:hypothetical protein
MPGGAGSSYVQRNDACCNTDYLGESHWPAQTRTEANAGSTSEGTLA